MSQFVLGAIAAHESQHVREVMRAQHGASIEIPATATRLALAPRPPNRAERRAAMRRRLRP